MDKLSSSGLDTSALDILAQLVEEMGINVEAWKTRMLQAEEEIHRVISKTQNIMQQWRIHGFPTFILEKEDSLTRLPHSQFYGNPSGWQELLNNV